MQEGRPPEGLYYGSEYTRAEINAALRAADPFELVPSRDENGHGSAMAAVAAGSRLTGENAFNGAAPEADIVVVKLKECKPYLREYYLVPEGVPAYEESDIMLAVKYADSFAVPFSRPVVICLGLGSSMGDHCGSSFLSGYLNHIAVRRSRGVVVCGGNEGNSAHHYAGSLAPSGRGGSYQDVELRVGENERGFLMEFWGNVPDTYNIAIRSPGGETIPPVRLGTDQIDTYRFIYERTVITVQSTLVEPGSGAQLMVLRVEDPTPGIWNLRVFGVGELHNGSFNIWLPIADFLSSEVYFLEPSPYITLTDPAMALGVISVTFYNDVNNSFSLESGRGYSRMGLIRPDIAAPGVNVSTPYGRRTGGSLAAAMTAGAIALFMQWSVVEDNIPLLESKEIRNYFIKGATRSPDIAYPNREWGYGRLNLAGVFDVLAGV